MPHFPAPSLLDRRTGSIMLRISPGLGAMSQQRFGLHSGKGDPGRLLNTLIAWASLFCQKRRRLCRPVCPDGSEYARACYAVRNGQPYRGSTAEKISSMEIRIVDHCMVSELIRYRGRVIGAFGIDKKEKKLKGLKVFFLQKPVVMAAGRGRRGFQSQCISRRDGRGWLCPCLSGRSRVVNMNSIQIRFVSSVKFKLTCSRR